jgi:hypothetical protein
MFINIRLFRDDNIPREMRHEQIARAGPDYGGRACYPTALTDLPAD